MATIDDYFFCLDTFDPIMANTTEPTNAPAEPKEPESKEPEKKEPSKRKTRKRKYANVSSVPVGKGQPSPCEEDIDTMPSSKWDKGTLQQKMYCVKMYFECR